MNERTVKLQSEDCLLHVTVKENDNANGVIVMLHGGPGSGAKPLMALPAFQAFEKEFSVVYFDQRGSGESDYDLAKGLTADQIAADVKVVVDYTTEKFADKDVYLWGGSFGGLLSLLFLERYPTAVKKAIISSPAICLSCDESRIGQFAMLKAMAAEIFPESVVKIANAIEPTKDALLTVMGSQEVADYFAEHKKPIVGFEGVFHMYAMQDWLFTTCDMRSSIANIQVPTLFLQGMDDPMCLPKLLIDAVENYPNPNVSLKTYQNCGHAVFEDCKEEFVQACYAFYHNK